MTRYKLVGLMMLWLAVLSLLVACGDKGAGGGDGDGGGGDIVVDDGSGSGDGGESGGDTGGDADAGYEAITVEGGGTLKGAVIWDGSDASKHATFDYQVGDADKGTCGKGGHVVADGAKRKNQRLQLGDRADGKKGVRYTVVWLEISKGAALKGGDVTLDNMHCEFEPHVFLLPSTAKLKITTSDGAISHNAKAIYVYDGGKQKQLFNSQIPQAGFVHDPGKSKYPGTTPSSGRLHITCSQHYWMGGFAIVHSHPYYAVSDAKGNFELKTPIPPGKYTLHFWHSGFKPEVDKAGGKVAGVMFSNDVAWTKEVEIKAGENSLGEVTFGK